MAARRGSLARRGILGRAASHSPPISARDERGLLAPDAGLIGGRRGAAQPRPRMAVCPWCRHTKRLPFTLRICFYAHRE